MRIVTRLSSLPCVYEQIIDVLPRVYVRREVLMQDRYPHFHWRNTVCSCLLPPFILDETPKRLPFDTVGRPARTFILSNVLIFVRNVVATLCWYNAGWNSSRACMALVPELCF